METTLKNNLEKLFKNHNIVFWYDEKNEFSDVLAEEISGVKVVKASDYNTFALKYYLLKGYFGNNVLVYFNCDEPKYEDNWLLDIQLENAVFRTDYESILLSELSLPRFFLDTIKAYPKFFSNKTYVSELKTKVHEGTSIEEFEKIILTTAFNKQNYNLQEMIDLLVRDNVNNNSKLIKKLEQCGVDKLLWHRIGSVYRYNSELPSIEDFYLSVFETSLCHFLGKNEILSPDAYTLLSHWKDSAGFNEIYRFISQSAHGLMGEPIHDLYKVELEKISDFDDYASVDEMIIEQLRDGIMLGTLDCYTLDSVIDKRKSSFWYNDYSVFYDALARSLDIFTNLKRFRAEMNSPEEGFRNYSTDWYQIDQAYRNFMHSIRHMPASALADSFVAMQQRIETEYINAYLIPLNEKWTAEAVKLFVAGWNSYKSWCEVQNNFFMNYVKNQKRRIVVVISDAMRYEIGDELKTRINMKNRYSAEIKPMLSSVPSYTQLGMASLLPHEELYISDKGDNVSIENGQSTQGIENRNKILSDAMHGNGCAYKAEDILKMTTTRLRDEVIKDNNVIYIYHNVIDARGPSDLYNAAEDAIDELLKLIHMLGSSNVNNVLITSDHGFLYQDSELNEHLYYSEGFVQGREVTSVNGRRFILGRELEKSVGACVAKSTDLGMSNQNDLEIAFPNSILRYRKKGSDTNFVHGGLSLQEVVIPLITVEKKRKDNVEFTELQLMTNLKQITTSSVVLRFFQVDYVSDKMRGFEAEFALYSDDGVLLSNIEKRSIDNPSADSHARIFNVELILNHKAESYNRKQVKLVVSRILLSGRKETIIEKSCLLMRSMMSDFDF